MKPTPEPDYHAYLLRLWREQPENPWRASLEDPHTGERQSFTNLEKLVCYLEGLTWRDPEEQSNQNTERSESHG
jgi:hypothetical protein